MVLVFECLCPTFKHIEVVYVGSIYFIPYHLNALGSIWTLNPRVDFKGTSAGYFLIKTHSPWFHIERKKEIWAVSWGRLQAHQIPSFFSSNKGNLLHLLSLNCLDSRIPSIESLGFHFFERFTFRCIVLQRHTLNHVFFLSISIAYLALWLLIENLRKNAWNSMNNIVLVYVHQVFDKMPQCTICSTYEGIAF